MKVMVRSNGYAREMLNVDEVVVQYHPGTTTMEEWVDWCLYPRDVKVRFREDKAPTPRNDAPYRTYGRVPA